MYHKRQVRFGGPTILWVHKHLTNIQRGRNSFRLYTLSLLSQSGWGRLLLNPLNPNIKIEILICCLYTFSIEVVGRISWSINCIHSVIMPLTLMTTLFCKTVILQGEIWRWSLLRLGRVKELLSCLCLPPKLEDRCVTTKRTDEYWDWVTKPRKERIILSSTCSGFEGLSGTFAPKLPSSASPPQDKNMRFLTVLWC